MALPPFSPPPPDRIGSFAVPTSWGVTNEARFFKLMEEAVTLVGPGYFFGDNLFTWYRNNSFCDDAPFMRAWSDNIQDGADKAIVWRRFILACAAYHCVQLPGDFVECGVYGGTGVKTVVDYLGGAAFPKTFWAYDTFDYNPVEGHAFEGQKEGFFEVVQKRFAGYPQVKLVKGLIPAAFDGNEPAEISYLHIDLNNAKSEIATLNRLFDKLVTGGLIILDDYEWSGIYREQKIAEDKWFDERKYRVMPLPTGQGLIIKR